MPNPKLWRHPRQAPDKPAAEAHVDRVDRSFTRTGASDGLARGQSTFMAELSEMASLLNLAAPPPPLW